MNEITVIGSVLHSKDWWDKAGEARINFINGASRTGEIYMTNVQTMVTRVTAAAEGDKVTRLNIIDHGDKKRAFFGQDCLTCDNFEKFAPVLGRLGSLFNTTSIVHLQHCEVGQNQDLLRMFAGTIGVAVYAGTGYHNSLLRENYGEYVRCSPSGTIYNNAISP